MRPYWRAIVVGAVLAVAVAPAASPFWAHGVVPRTNDLAPHLYRALALTRIWSWDNLWPRWSPDLVQGYGYPVFNFFPALSHMAVVAVAQVGLPLTTAYRIVVFLHFWLAAVGVYLFGLALGREIRPKHHISTLAAWLGALAYVYSPYLLYDTHIRGSLPEAQALAILPWLALAWQQAARGRLKWIVALPFVLAAMLLSHYPATYQTLWLFGLGWAAIVIRRGRSALVGPAVGLALGVLLTAFFWWPTLTEIKYTRSDLSISQGYGLADNFLFWPELAAWPVLPTDPALVNPPVVRPLPLTALLVGCVGLLWGWRRLPPTRRQAAGLALALIALCAWLITPGSAWVWRLVPLLAQTLYPWRLLGVASWLGAALVIISAESFLAHTRRPVLLTAGLSALFITAAIPWLFPPREPMPEEPTLADLFAFEAPPNFIGTTTLGEFLPRTVTELPDSAELRAELLHNGQADRLDGCALAAQGCTSPNPLAAEYQLSLAEPTRFTYRQFAFPGWQVILDGAPLAWRISQPDGLITFTLPAGAHHLKVVWADTPPRQWGAAMSWLTLIGLIPATALVGRRLARAQDNESAESIPRSVRPLLGLALLTLAVWAAWATFDTPLRRSRLTPAGVLGAPAMTPLDYAGELRLLAVELPAALPSAAAPLSVTLYWQALHQIGAPYEIGVQVLDDRGVVWNTPDNARPRNWRFIGNDPWPPTGYRLEPFRITLLDGAPPGRYHLDAGVVRRDTGQTIAAHTLGYFDVVAPAHGERPLEAGLLPLQPPPEAGGLRLLGVRPDRAEARPGDPVRVGLLWQVVGPAANRFSLALVDAAGVNGWATEQAVSDSFPATAWQVGDRLRSETVLRLPAGLTGGEYRWQATWAGRAPLTLASLRLSAPERIFTPPADYTSVTAEPLGETATLLGGVWQPVDAHTARLTLLWRAEQVTTTSYRVFVHVLDAAGNIVTQSDGEPADWTRPTTGWLPGEIVPDTHKLDVGVADLAGLRVAAGMYDPADGRRLQTPAGVDALTVPGP